MLCVPFFRPFIACSILVPKSRHMALTKRIAPHALDQIMKFSGMQFNGSSILRLPKALTVFTSNFLTCSTCSHEPILIDEKRLNVNVVFIVEVHLATQLLHRHPTQTTRNKWFNSNVARLRPNLEGGKPVSYLKAGSRSSTEENR